MSVEDNELTFNNVSLGKRIYQHPKSQNQEVQGARHKRPSGQRHSPEMVGFGPNSLLIIYISDVVIQHRNLWVSFCLRPIS